MKLWGLRTGRVFFFSLMWDRGTSTTTDVSPYVSNPTPVFICLHAGCEGSFPTAKLLEVHAIIHATEYSAPGIYSTPTGSLSGTVYDEPTGFSDPKDVWLNPFNSIGISGHDHIDPAHNTALNSLAAIGEGAFTQGFDPSGIASYGPYDYSPPTTAAPPLTHAVAQTSNVANATGSAQPGVVCAKCGTHVKRQSDLGRHMKKHQSDAQVFRCQIQGCQYSSKRKDKVMEHSRRPH